MLRNLFDKARPVFISQKHSCLFAGAVVLAFVFGHSHGTAAGAGTPLTRLDVRKMTSSWSAPLVDRSVTNQPLTIAGTCFEHGVGTHAASEFAVDLEGKILTGVNTPLC